MRTGSKNSISSNTVSPIEPRSDDDQQEFDSPAAVLQNHNSLISNAVSFVLRLICLTLLFLLLIAPLYQLAYEPIPRMAIHAVNVPGTHPPQFSWSSFVKGKFQARFEDWFLKRHGLYGYLLRLSNEFTYQIFNQVSLNYGTTVYVGKEKQLFQPMYLSSLNKQGVEADAVFEKRAKDIKRLQSLLEKRGIASTLLISTNLLEFYPELVPANFKDPTRATRKSSYEKIRPLLDRYKLNYIDGHELLTARKNDYPYRFFQPSASHWNHVASCLVTQSLVSQIAQLTKKSLPRVQCQPIEMSHRALGRDHDLLDVTNLYFITATNRPAPYVHPEKRTLDPGRYKPRILFVGTSFSMTITEELLAQGVTKDVMHFFYYKKFRPGNGGFFPIDHANIDWEKQVLSYDAIVIEANVANISGAGYKFPAELLAYLDSTR